ncbi:MAG TPA: HPF/RaiA family ribosome-associated protein [Marmoricola sp.]
MDIQVRTDHHIKGEQALISFVEEEVAAGLRRWAGQLTRTQVHLSLETGSGRGPVDLACVIEVRPRGHGAVAVTGHATTTGAAVAGALEDMQRLLERMFQRLDRSRPGADSIRHA